ncbi:unnamed protein product [Parnassius mnemosyne]|uniref:Uncharacterized protein n=1 Tax=Parnassius mnemosyne TaxID=213953 RepID=A0AAV1KCU1_9NEOP
METKMTVIISPLCWSNPKFLFRKSRIRLVFLIIDLSLSCLSFPKFFNGVLSPLLFAIFINSINLCTDNVYELICEDSSNNRKKLFEKALFYAKYGKVLYILQEELNELPELSQDLSSLNRHYMKMISFLYARSLNSLIESISTLPDWKHVPNTIILDNLNGYCNKNNLHKACGIVALLLDTVQSCSNTLNKKCQLYISVDKQAVGEGYCTLLQEMYLLKIVK